MNETNNFSNENNTQEIEFAKLKDGTDISMLSNDMRRVIRSMSYEEFIQWHDAYKTTAFFADEMESGNPLYICSGDYIFPQNIYKIFIGYIVRVRTREWEGKEYLYLDIIFGKNMIKTIRCIPSLLSDVVSTAIRKKFGRFFNPEDLIYSSIRVKVKNTLDENKEVTFSKIVYAQIFGEEIYKYYNEAFNAVVNTNCE